MRARFFLLLLWGLAMGCVSDSVRACENGCGKAGMDSFTSTAGCSGAGVCKCRGPK